MVEQCDIKKMKELQFYHREKDSGDILLTDSRQQSDVD